jgi:hypothetical protein
LTGQQAEIAQAVAEALSMSFQMWQDTVTVPGLPWYPTFAAYPGPFAAPTPNIPYPLIACVSQNFSKLTNYTNLQYAIEAQLSSSHKQLDQYDNFIFGLCVHLSNFFTTVIVSTNVMMVMGMGPVPTYNPPYVPVGSVVNGYIIPAPGHLAA